MEEKEQKEPTPPPIIDQLKEYAETQIKLAKYEAIEQGSKLLSGIMVDVIVSICFVLTFLFVSLAIAFALSSLLHSYWAGFGCMAAIYLIIALVIMYRRDKLKPRISNMFIKNFFD